MKKIASLVLFVLFTINSFSQTSFTNYKESGFGAKFPVTPRIENQTINTAVGETPMTMFLSEGKDFMIMVSVNHFPGEIIQKLDKKGSENMLNGSKNGALNNLAKQLGGEYKADKEEYYLFDNKFHALKVNGTVNGIELSANYILKNNQLYQILAMGNLAAQEVTDFNSSFKLIY